MFGEVFSFFFRSSTFLHCANYRIQTRLFLPKIGGGIPFPFPGWKEKTPVFTKAVTHKKPNQTTNFPPISLYKIHGGGALSGTQASIEACVPDSVFRYKPCAFCQKGSKVFQNGSLIRVT
jgi:hypothetical protein